MAYHEVDLAQCMKLYVLCLRKIRYLTTHFQSWVISTLAKKSLVSLNEIQLLILNHRKSLDYESLETLTIEDMYPIVPEAYAYLKSSLGFLTAALFLSLL